MEPTLQGRRLSGAVVGRFTFRRGHGRPLPLEHLDVLRQIQAAAEVAHLILAFGPHAGETLGQVAQSDRSTSVAWP